jgi:hypothetical protein
MDKGRQLERGKEATLKGDISGAIESQRSMSCLKVLCSSKKVKVKFSSNPS